MYRDTEGVVVVRQIWITRAGPPEVLRVKEAADPAPNTGEVRIRVEASGVNFADIMGRMGVYPDLPPIPVVTGWRVTQITSPRRAACKSSRSSCARAYIQISIASA